MVRCGHYQSIAWYHSSKGSPHAAFARQGLSPRRLFNQGREPLLADEWREDLFSVLGGTANNLGCQSLIVGGVPDHVLMLFQLGRSSA
jgi:hypothetical protein